MKKFVTTILFILLFLEASSQIQKTIYVGENYEQIHESDFNKLLKTNLFDTAKIISDSVIYVKLRYREYFGKLKNGEKSQLNKLFSSRYQIDSTKKWLIHYVDTLPNKEKMPKYSGVIVYDSVHPNKTIFMSKKEFNRQYKNYVTKHKHVFSYPDYQRNIRKEIKKISKKINFIHIYNYNKGIPSSFLREIKYYKDNVPIFKNIFSDGMMNYKTILIYPNGSFYLANNYNIYKEELLLNRSWYKKKKKIWFSSHEK